LDNAKEIISERYWSGTVSPPGKTAPRTRKGEETLKRKKKGAETLRVIKTRKLLLGK